MKKRSSFLEGLINPSVLKFIKRLGTKTPLVPKLIRNLCVVGVIAIPTLASGVTGLKTPDWFSNYGWYAFAVCTIVGVYCQSIEIKPKAE